MDEWMNEEMNEPPPNEHQQKQLYFRYQPGRKVEKDTDVALKYFLKNHIMNRRYNYHSLKASTNDIHSITLSHLLNKSWSNVKLYDTVDVKL